MSREQDCQDFSGPWLTCLSPIYSQEFSLPLPEEAPKKEEEMQDQLQRYNGNITDDNVQRSNGKEYGN